MRVRVTPPLTDDEIVRYYYIDTKHGPESVDKDWGILLGSPDTIDIQKYTSGEQVFTDQLSAMSPSHRLVNVRLAVEKSSGLIAYCDSMSDSVRNRIEIQFIENLCAIIKHKRTKSNHESDQETETDDLFEKI